MFLLGKNMPFISCFVFLCHCCLIVCFYIGLYCRSGVCLKKGEKLFLSIFGCNFELRSHCECELRQQQSTLMLHLSYDL